MTRVVLHIDKLVVIGMNHANAAELGAGINAELRRLLVQPEVVAKLVGDGHRYRVTPDSVQIDQSKSAHRLGRKVAKSIVNGVKF